MLCPRQRGWTSGCQSLCSLTRRIVSAPSSTMIPPSQWWRKVTTPGPTFQMWRTGSSTPGRKIRSLSADSTTSVLFAITGKITSQHPPNYRLRFQHELVSFWPPDLFHGPLYERKGWRLCQPSSWHVAVSWQRRSQSVCSLFLQVTAAARKSKPGAGSFVVYLNGNVFWLLSRSRL